MKTLEKGEGILINRKERAYDDQRKDTKRQKL